VLAFCDHHIIDDAGVVDVDATDSATRRFGRAGLSEGVVEDFLGVVIRQSIKLTGCVWRLDALDLGELDPGVAAHLDVWLAYLLARGGAPAYFSPQRLMSYRLHNGSHSASRDPAVWLAGIECGQRMLGDPTLKAHADVLTKRVAGYHRLAAEAMLRQGMRSAAREHLCSAIHLCPTPRALTGWAASWIAPTVLLARL
jgi:hypothetical protein